MHLTNKGDYHNIET